MIAYARTQRRAIAGLDDRKARDPAESLGLAVTGTLGIIVRARQAGLVASVRPLLDALVSQGFRLGAAVYDDVLTLVGEAP